MLVLVRKEATASLAFYLAGSSSLNTKQSLVEGKNIFLQSITTNKQVFIIKRRYIKRFILKYPVRYVCNSTLTRVLYVCTQVTQASEWLFHGDLVEHNNGKINVFI